MTSRRSLAATAAAIGVALALAACGSSVSDTTTVGSIGGHRAALGVYWNGPTNTIVVIPRADVRVGTRGHLIITGPRHIACLAAFSASPTPEVPWYAWGDDRTRAQVAALPFLDFGNAAWLNLKGPGGHYTFSLFVEGMTGSVSRSLDNPPSEGQSQTAGGGWNDPLGCGEVPSS